MALGVVVDGQNFVYGPMAPGPAFRAPMTFSKKPLPADLRAPIRKKIIYHRNLSARSLINLTTKLFYKLLGLL